MLVEGPQKTVSTSRGNNYIESPLYNGFNQCFKIIKEFRYFYVHQACMGNI